MTSTHLLDHVGAELLHRQRADVPSELPDNRIAEAVVVEVEDVLDDVVAVRVLDEGEGVVRDLVDELDALRFGRVVDAALEDAAAVAVRRDLDAVRGDGVVDELYGMSQHIGYKR